jgi:NitT/TauT family transport system substrate-binding protein
MRATQIAVAFAAWGALAAGSERVAAQDMLKVSVPQRGSWDTGISELGQRAGIFKRHGLTLDILYTEGGAESQQAVIGGSMDIAVGVGVGSVLSAFTKGAPVRVISGEMIGSPNQFWYVPANSPIRILSPARRAIRRCSSCCANITWWRSRPRPAACRARSPP